MILYLDTSALVKLYIDEAESTAVKQRVEVARIVSTSRVAYVEARAGIARKFREAELSKTEYKHMIEDLEEDWQSYFIVEVSESITKLAGQLVHRNPLRGFDAIHLASALFLKNRTHLELSFACVDERLKDAARREGLTIITLE
jgi:predicted nucleic acid-binding protein